MSNLWVLPNDLGDDYEDDEYAYDACKFASFVLWGLSGRKYAGITSVTERYTTGSALTGVGHSTRNTNAGLVDGDVANVNAGDYDYFAEILSDGRSPLSRIKLRGRPVVRINAIRLANGQILDPSSYYLVDHSTVQSAMGAPWTPGNVEISYTYGQPAPVAGKMAAREFARELLRLWNDDDNCALPQRVTNVTRQGISFTILDNQDFLNDMRTGMYVVDVFLKTVNPDNARTKARVLSPDVPRARRTTPKPLKLAPTALDITVYQDGGEQILPLDLINAAFLLDNTGWVPQIFIRNWSGSSSLELDGGAIGIDEIAEDATIAIQYSDAVRILGMADSGTWDLYASRPSISTPGDIEIVFVASGNLQINLIRGTISAFTLGE